MRGEKLDITRGDGVARMLALLCAVPVPPSWAPSDAGQRAVEYRLDDSGRLGGYNPGAGEPWSWSFGGRTPTCDCVGATTGAIGIDRRQMAWAFPQFSGDMNCESILKHAQDTKTIWRTLEPGEKPVAGDVFLTPGIRTLLGRKPGHIEMVIRPPTVRNPQPLLCGASPRHKGQAGQGVGVGTAWSSNGVYVRYLGYKDDAYRGPYPQFTGKR